MVNKGIDYAGHVDAADYTGTVGGAAVEGAIEKDDD